MTSTPHARSDEFATPRTPPQPLPPSPDMQFVVPPVTAATEADRPTNAPRDTNSPSSLAAAVAVIAVMVLVAAVIVILSVLGS